MKKFNLFMIALISMFAFSLGVNAMDVATKDDFVSAMNAGGDVKLTADIEVDNILVVTKDVNLDLNGHEVKFAANKYIQLEKGKLNILGEGKMYEVSPNYAPIYIASSASEADTSYVTLTVGKDVTLEGWAGIFIKYKNETVPTAYGVTVNLYGKINAKNDASGDHGAGIYVNGNIIKEVNAPVINVYDGAVINSTGHGIFSAGYAIYNIYGGTITGGDTGVEVRTGQLNVTGGEIKSLATSYNVSANGNGSTTVGAAVAVAQHTTKKDVKVTITGGTFKGVVAFSEANPQGNSEEDLNKIVLSITGGDFTTTSTSSTAKTVVSEDKEGFIAGGTYNAGFEDEYLKDDFEVSTDANGNTIVLDASGLYDWYERILDLDEEDYTEASVKALEDYMDSLENLAPKSQEELDAIVAKLNELTNALETPEEEKARLEREEAEKKANEDKKTNNPDTGDSIYLYVGILTISALAIGALVLNRRKSYR